MVHRQTHTEAPEKLTRAPERNNRVTGVKRAKANLMVAFAGSTSGGAYGATTALYDAISLTLALQTYSPYENPQLCLYRTFGSTEISTENGLSLGQRSCE